MEKVSVHFSLKIERGLLKTYSYDILIISKLSRCKEQLIEEYNKSLYQSIIIIIYMYSECIIPVFNEASGKLCHEWLVHWLPVTALTHLRADA